MRSTLEEQQEAADGWAKELQNLTDAADATVDAEQRKIMARLAKVQTQHATTDAEQTALRKQVGAAEQAYRASVERFRASKAELDVIAEDVKAKTTQLAEMKKGSFNRVSQLHPAMPQVLQSLKKNAKMFESAPIGPLGLHISIKDEHQKLAPAVEIALGQKAILGWIVSCKQDEIALRKVLQAVPQGSSLNALTFIQVQQPRPRYALLRDSQSSQGGAEPPNKRQRGRTSGAGSSTELAPPITDAPLLIDVLDITSDKPSDADTIFNQLLDVSNAESRLLFIDLAEAERVTFASSLPRVEGYACARYATPGRKFFRKGQTTGAEWAPMARNLLARDQASAQAQLAAELDVAKREGAAKQNAHAHADAARKECEATEKGLRKSLKAAQDKYAKLDDELGHLQGETAESSVLAELHTLQQNTAAAKAQVAGYEQQLAELEESATELEQKFQPLKAKNEENQNTYNDYEAQAAAAADAVTKARAPITKSVTKISQMRKALTDAQNGMKAAQEEVDRLEVYLQATVPQVEEAYGERVHDPEERDVETLRKEKSVLEVKQKKEQARQGGRSLEELAQRAKAASEAASAGREGIETVRQIGEKEQVAFQERKKFFRKQAKVYGKQASADFNQRLSRKNHAGELYFDHDQEVLTLQVQRNSQDTESATTQDARNLSGGERSFTTLAFELAMWEFCATPFRVLDEFDVFMDDTYRKQAVQLLLDMCDSQPQRQFLFITPQDMHPFLAARLADKSMQQPTITKMKDPRPKAAN